MTQSQIVVRVDAERTRPVPTVVYQAFDAGGLLLYVGITGTFNRFDQHAADSGWWSEVARIEIEHFPDRASAVARERDLIRSLQPPWNRAGRGRTLRVDRDLLTTTDVAEWFGTSIEWVRDHAAELSGVMDGRHWRFDRSTVAAWLETQAEAETRARRERSGDA